MIEPITVFIGYDERQHEAFLACQQSILETSSGPVIIYPLKHQELRDLGFFTRPWAISEKGAFTDKVDGKPFSTQFSHTRFLVPYLSRLHGHTHGYTVFVDSDFIFLTDIHQMIKEIDKDSLKSPVYCVQHDYTSDTNVKMDGREQFNYNKKLWTSLMVFNTNHSMLDRLDPYVVNTMSGRDMHQFHWLKGDEFIGKIPETWNFIPGHSEKNVDHDAPINAIHYTMGTPHMDGYQDCDYCDFYWQAYARAIITEAQKIADSRYKKINVNHG